MTPEQRNSEPMITITVRQRDQYLYMIKELMHEVDMLKAKLARLKRNGAVDPLEGNT